MNTMDYELVPPRADSMIEALRAVGYSLQTALADLVDNSITAGAENVWLRFVWDGPASFVTLTDDGSGMSEQELRAAMRPGSRSPLEQRSATDLGRFGLGLKTASFSQARCLTVASRRESTAVAVRRWDLDVVGECGEWRLLKSAREGSAKRLHHFNGMAHGTVILWEQMDRVVGDARVDDEQAQHRFLNTVQAVKQHLGMVFHRYLDGEVPGRRPLRIYVNGDNADALVEAWDPFLSSHLATRNFPSETLEFRGQRVTVTGFVLPHKDRVKPAEYEAAQGPGGWSAQQGFYVYRNQRLLAAGGWLGLGFSNEEHYRLARLKVDIPNSTDAEWEIDVKKSRARPPAELQARVRELAETVRKCAREVFVHRGARLSTGAVREVDVPWYSTTKAGRRAWRVRREHPLVKFVLARQGADSKPLKALLRLLEESVPVERIWLDMAEQPDQPAAPFQGERASEVMEVMREMFRALRSEGDTVEQARNRLLTIPLFLEHGAAVQALCDGSRE